MNHYKKILELTCEMCRDKNWRKKYPSGVTHDWGTNDYKIQDCHNYYSEDKDDTIFEISINNKSDDEILNAILSFLGKPLVPDEKTYYISTIHQAASGIENQDSYIWVTRDNYDENHQITKDRTLRFCIVNSENIFKGEQYYVDLNIESLTNKEIFEFVMDKLEKVENAFKLNEEIFDLIQGMHDDWEECIVLQPKLYEILKKKFL